MHSRGGHRRPRRLKKSKSLAARVLRKKLKENNNSDYTQRQCCRRYFVPRFEIPSSDAFVIPVRPFVIAIPLWREKQPERITEFAPVAPPLAGLPRNDKCF